ncbi:HTH CENPB-type domain-containing protein [Caenorhabditis elegans]|uniref:HTH CENPB-type domain-containing protein n=1 Tax=Caenorhabditis elegans TaxID=6239 RepID=Q18704_CAEEL|nr:HTH CENPB-type domain-containing protein [Caenorhabditis elegans]CCD67643.1 HTH CENPB-type domain-containing protein [Caenorhabditis elegans]|eukprot:NP_501479.1 Uncharacterized protein CELE_C49C8.3 [Caenorhabditis elegans]
MSDESEPHESDVAEMRYEYTKDWDPFMVKIGNRLVRGTEVEKAIKYYYKDGLKPPANGKSKPRKFSSLSERYRFVKNENDLKKIREMKKNGLKFDASHMRFFIGLEMEIETEKRIADGESITIKDHLEMFERIREDHKIPNTITAGVNWVFKWRRENLKK